MKRLLLIGYLLVAALVGLKAAQSSAASKPLDYARDIRPLLSDNCFTCHGPDENARKGGLRLDLPEMLLNPAKSGKPPIVPGNVAGSELIKRILTKDEDDVMPPLKGGKKLTTTQVDLLQRWIKEGAKAEGHWAFATPKRPSIPQTKARVWGRNEIDYFVGRKLKSQNLKPSPDADKASLHRRASLDVTGLPPSPEELDAFLSDKSHDAYEKVVDQLLASPRFGEHMSRYWLDAVRYADTHGYHIDAERSMWKYRDWLIDAFNNNLPFDRFTVEQLGGDLLPDASLDQKVASGYVRANMTTGEGGAIEEEYMAKYAFDRAETTATIYLGLTMICSRCHNHKYDAVTQKEYYELYAFFNTLNESVMDGNGPNPEPVIKVPSAEQAARLDVLKRHMEGAQKRIDSVVPDLDVPQSEWEATWRSVLGSGWKSAAPLSARCTATNGPALRILEDTSVLAEGSLAETDNYELTFALPAGPLGGLRLETMPDPSLHKKAAGRADDGRFSVSELEIDLVTRAGLEGEKSTRLKVGHAYANAAEKDRGINRVIDGKNDTAWSLSSEQASAPGVAVFALAERAEVLESTRVKVRLKFEGMKDKETLGRFRIAFASQEPLVTALTPQKFSDWQVLGPLPAPDPRAAYADVLDPEKELDLKRAYPGVKEESRWQGKGDIEDGKSNLLVQDLHGIHGVRYLHRTIRSERERDLVVSTHVDGWFKLWLNGTLAGERDHEEKPGEGALRTTLRLQKGENTLLVKIVTVQGASSFTFSSDPESRETVTPPVAVILALGSPPTERARNSLRDYYRRQHSSDFKKVFQNLSGWREEDAALDRTIPRTMIAKEMDKPRVTHVLMRGEYDQKADPVLPGTPAVLSPWPSNTPTNRLGLARWLMDPQHPLASRVNANRIWQQFFGTGIVKTVEDFGVQGDPPSHPELLEWLACQFRDGGQVAARVESKTAVRDVKPWDVKEYVRLILTSSTYRQSSKSTSEAHSRDPENRLLARGPRFRLDGESVRDSALFVGGLLVEQRGGRSVKPYEPPGLWETVSFNNSQKYVPEPGDAQHRRSLYTFWKRQSPPPNMMIFDAPTREYCTVRRSRSNTPLQALVMLNDPHFVEASRALADRMQREGGGTARERLRYGFRLATARYPKSDELAVLEQALRNQIMEFKNDVGSAEKLLQIGSYQTICSIPRFEMAAWTSVANLLLNLDEMLTKN